MPEKKRRPASEPPRLEIVSKEILVARNRTAEPYLHLFSVLPENVTQEPLGRLMGVFSTSDRSESSAYVGNVIASVARKEYFANTRRDAVESFESALHRANIALSELVKRGDARFMGQLHGVLAAIEHGTIHFSVTGEARILLFRDGTLTDIGDGLASEDAAAHPMKTFVEISSGRLLPGDCVVLASPELFSLLPLSALERNAGRLVPEGKFPAFLETAMRNELRTGTALILEVTEVPGPEAVPERKSDGKPKKGRKQTPNYFSELTFREARQEQAALILDADTSAESDKETPDISVDAPRSGTIYVKGEAPPETEEHPLLTTIRWQYESLRRDMGIRSKKSLAALGEAARETAASLSSHSGSAIRSARTSLKRALGSLIGGAGARAKRLARRAKKTTPGTDKPKRHNRDADSANAAPEHIPDNPILARALELTRERHPKSAAAPHPKPKARRRRSIVTDRYTPGHAMEATRQILQATISGLAPLGRTAWRLFSDIAHAGVSGTSRFLRATWKRFLALPKRRQMILAAGAAFLFTFIGIGIWKASDGNEPEVTAPVMVIEEPEPAFPPTDEPNATLASPETAFSGNGTVIAPVFLRDRLLVVTEAGVATPEDGRLFEAPTDSPIVLATGMDDLSLVLLLTEAGEVYSFAPGNGTFTGNAIDLPEGFRPAGIGTFLTYLYLLDGSSGSILRYPRAEGGFGERMTWSSEPVAPETTSIAVNGSIYVASGSEITSLFRGKPTTGFTPKSPTAPLTATAVCANEERPDRFAVLDAPAHRLILYDEQGALIAQYFHESFADMTACALDEAGTRVAVSSPESVHVVPLDE